MLKGRRRNRHVLEVTHLSRSVDDAHERDGRIGQDGAVTLAPDQESSADDSDASWRRYRFRSLYDENHEDLWRYCLRRASTTQEAEEALAETFSVAWRRLDIVPKGAGARPWLFGVARNKLRSGWRKNKRSSELRDRLVHARTCTHSPDPADEVVIEPSPVLVAMATLREKDQEILRLSAWEELPHAQIAQLIGCSENAVSIRIHRARNRLATSMDKHAKSATHQRNRGNVKAPAVSEHVVGNSPTPATGTEA